MPEEEQTPPEGGSKALPDDPAALRSEIEKLRRENAGHRTKNKDLESRLAEAEKSKPADEQTAEKLAQLEKDLTEERHKRLKAEVAAVKGLTPAQAKRLNGSTQEELETDADDILEHLPAPSTKDDDEERSGPPSRRPRPDLRGGSDPTDTPVEMDPAKLADSVPRL